jgi:hypothetical protein
MIPLPYVHVASEPGLVDLADVGVFRIDHLGAARLGDLAEQPVGLGPPESSNRPPVS